VELSFSSDSLGLNLSLVAEAVPGVWLSHGTAKMQNLGIEMLGVMLHHTTNEKGLRVRGVVLCHASKREGPCQQMPE
jgi:hypothetical protein